MTCRLMSSARAPIARACSSLRYPRHSDTGEVTCTGYHHAPPPLSHAKGSPNHSHT
jgi:hypothetical protein